MEIERDRLAKELQVSQKKSQKKYADPEEFLKQFNSADAKAVRVLSRQASTFASTETPSLQRSIPLERRLEDCSTCRSVRGRTLPKSLPKPFGPNALGALARYLAKPKMVHWNMAKQL